LSAVKRITSEDFCCESETKEKDAKLKMKTLIRQRVTKADDRRVIQLRLEDIHDRNAVHGFLDNVLGWLYD
jgi:hypothetical protein